MDRAVRRKEMDAVLSLNFLRRDVVDISVRSLENLRWVKPSAGSFLDSLPLLFNCLMNCICSQAPLFQISIFCTCARTRLNSLNLFCLARTFSDCLIVMVTGTLWHILMFLLGLLCVMTTGP